MGQCWEKHWGSQLGCCWVKCWGQHLVTSWDAPWGHCSEQSSARYLERHWDLWLEVGWELNWDSRWGWHLDPM